MAYFRYGRRYRRYRKYRRFYRRYRRGYARKYVNGSSKSTVRLKVPVSTVMTFPITVTSDGQGHTIVTPSPAALISPFISPSGAQVDLCSALSSPLYQAYCNLYEEVKCIGMKVQFSVATQIGNAALPSLEIQTSVDRRLARADANAPPSYADMKTYSSYNSAIAVNNSIAKLSRSVYASDLIEKAAWHDCTLSAAGADSTYNSSTDVPFFVPGLWIAMTSPTAPAATVNVSVSVEVMFYFAFRNPKYGGSSGSSKLIELGDVRLMDEGGDIDGDAMEDDVFARQAAAPANLQAEQPAPAPVDDSARAALRAASRAALREKTMDSQRQKRSSVVVPGPLRKN